MELLWLLLIPVFAVLNRLRGTGQIGSFKKEVTLFSKTFDIKMNGAILYGLVFGAYFVAAIGAYWAFFLGFALFMIGESFGWGKWVGTLCYTDEERRNHPYDYEDQDGHKFPYIHHIANLIVDERINYKEYCKVALSIRGWIWFAPILFALSTFASLSFVVAFILSAVLGCGFVVACLVGRDIKFTRKYGIFSFAKGWENQEWVYGAIQGLIFAITGMLI